MSEPTAFIGRQPIYDKDRRVFAYELLFRDSMENRARITDADEACRRTMIHALMDIGLDRLIGEHRAFINMTRSVLLDSSTLALPADRTVVEVLEDVAADPDVVERVRALAEEGYTIALDDFRFDEKLIPLIELADIVKLDVRALGVSGFAEQVEKLRPFGVELLAEKVETAEEMEATKKLGCRYFQGYFLSKPVVLSGSKAQPQQTSMLRVLAALQRPEATPADVDELIQRDPALSYKLLRYLNSSFFSLPSRVDTVRRALALLGLGTVRNWASLLLLSANSGASEELAFGAMIRATMCRELARARGVREVAPYFTLGLLSVLEALLGRPMAEVLAELPVVPEIAGALLERKGPMGEVLQAVLAYERGEWEGTHLGGVSEDQVVAAYLAGIDASQVLRGL